MMDDKRLQEIKARAEAATPGEWRYYPEDVVVSADSAELSPQGTYIAVQGANATDEDMHFIAHAREDIPALLDEVERLRAELEAAKRDIKAMLQAESYEKFCVFCKSIRNEMCMIGNCDNAEWRGVTENGGAE